MIINMRKRKNEYMQAGFEQYSEDPTKGILKKENEKRKLKESVKALDHWCHDIRQEAISIDSSIINRRKIRLN